MRNCFTIDSLLDVVKNRERKLCLSILSSIPARCLLVCDQFGHSLMHVVASISRDDIVALLIDKGVPSNNTNTKAETPIFFSCANLHERATQLLIQHDTFALLTRNTDGHTPLDVIVKPPHHATLFRSCTSLSNSDDQQSNNNDDNNDNDMEEVLNDKIAQDRDDQTAVCFFVPFDKHSRDARQQFAEKFTAWVAQRLKSRRLCGDFFGFENKSNGKASEYDRCINKRQSKQKLRIQICSDLHTEFHDDEKLNWNVFIYIKQMYFRFSFFLLFFFKKIYIKYFLDKTNAPYLALLGDIGVAIRPGYEKFLLSCADSKNW